MYMTDPYELQAMKSARAGARWLLWCLLLVSVSAYGVIATSFAWSRSRDAHYIYESIHTVGAIGYLIAAVLLTRNSSIMNGGRCARAWRLTAIACLLYRGLRIWAVLDRFAWNWPAIVSVGVLLDIVFVAMGTVVLTRILRKCNVKELARRMEMPASRMSCSCRARCYRSVRRARPGFDSPSSLRLGYWSCSGR